MLAWIYSVSFFISLAGLIMWFYVSKDRYWSRWMSKIFIGGFLIYLGSLAFSSGPLPFKLVILFRDLVVIALITQFFRFFRKNKIVFFGMMILLYVVFHFFLFKYMQNSLEKGAARDIAVSDSFELLVELREGSSVADVSEALADYNVQVEQAFYMRDEAPTLLDEYCAVGIADEDEGKIRKIKRILRRLKFVEWVEDNEEIHVDPVDAEVITRGPIVMPFNDPQVEQQWALDKLGVGSLYTLFKTTQLEPRKRAIIAILDTGVDGDHEDLQANYLSSRAPYDRDVRGHGTHCAGIAAAVTNNALGIASLVPSSEFVQVTSIKVLSDNGVGSQRKIAQGIIEAADLGADVISMSLGGRSNDSKQRAYNLAVSYANDKGAIVVVSAGNSSANARFFAPANSEGVIAVSAVDSDFKMAAFSNEVQDLEMGVAAPGVAVYSTFPNDRYRAMNGTSMSSPFVSGLIGLMKSIDPGLTTKEVYDILDDTGVASDKPRRTGKIIQPLPAVRQLLE